MKLENPIAFWGRQVLGGAAKYWGYFRVWRRCKKMLDATLEAPDRYSYSDLAIAPPKADEFDARDLYHATTGGEAAFERKYRGDAIPDKATEEHAVLAEAAE
ncbi:MAG: hypothetical protein P8Z80_11515 [Pseudolabrys sp.]|jgi:hypothetical protein